MGRRAPHRRRQACRSVEGGRRSKDGRGDGTQARLYALVDHDRLARDQDAVGHDRLQQRVERLPAVVYAHPHRQPLQAGVIQHLRVVKAWKSPHPDAKEPRHGRKPLKTGRLGRLDHLVQDTNPHRLVEGALLDVPHPPGIVLALRLVRQRWAARIYPLQQQLALRLAVGDRRLVRNRKARRLTRGVLDGQIGLEQQRAFDDAQHDQQKRGQDERKLDQTLAFPPLETRHACLLTPFAQTALGSNSYLYYNATGIHTQ